LVNKESVYFRALKTRVYHDTIVVEDKDIYKSSLRAGGNTEFKPEMFREKCKKGGEYSISK